MRQYSDKCRPSLILCCAIFVFAACARNEADVPVVTQNACVDCHETHSSGFNPAHGFAADNCVVCHGGDSQALDEPGAHAGLVAFLGNMDNAGRTCGSCHAERVASVSDGLMHTARGMVHTTRLVIDGDPGPAHTQNLQSLGHSMADSMLRKQCASCHLGHPKTVHAVDATTSRGGGCLACHIAAHPENAHPTLTADVSDARCFGCHSRSGRISLSFTGLAETDEPGLRLADGRTVEKLPADVHHLAGMGCTDCHDADDVMGAAGDAVHQRAAVSAQCTDCHEPHADDTQHARLTCAACHSQWAPQCFGCHMEFDEDGEQWDHVAQAVTPGRWSDRRWNVRNTLPALGVNADGMIEPFVPGMIMTIAHPDLDEHRFARLFAPLSPHTTGPSRSCISCHRSSEALGLGPGELIWRDGVLSLAPSANDTMPDSLSPEAWTNIGNTLGGRAPFPGQRAFNEEEMARIFGADIPQ